MNKRIALISFLVLILISPLGTQASVKKLSGRDAIRAIYKDIVGREPNQSELDKAIKKFTGSANLITELNRLKDRDAALIKLYQDAFQRDPSVKELFGHKKTKVKLGDLGVQLFSSNERQDAVKSLFEQIICRSPNSEELKNFKRKKLSLEKLTRSLNQNPKRCAPIAIVDAALAMDGEIKDLRLDGTNSRDPRGALINYQWEIVNGSPVGATLIDPESARPLLTFPADKQFQDYYATPGTYSVRLVVSNSERKSTPVVHNVTVSPYTSYEKLTLVKVNALRAVEGKDLDPLELEVRLTAAARKYSYYMRQNNWFDHLDKENFNFDKRIKDEGYDFALVAENILVVKSNKDDLSMNREAVEFFYNGWYNSPKHYENMVHPEFKQIGIGFSVGPAPDTETPWHQYGAQEFGTQRPPRPKIIVKPVFLRGPFSSNPAGDSGSRSR